MPRRRGTLSVGIQDLSRSMPDPLPDLFAQTGSQLQHALADEGSLNRFAPRLPGKKVHHVNADEQDQKHLDQVEENASEAIDLRKDGRSEERRVGKEWRARSAT